MSDIFREVEEDLRKERAQALWDKYGIWVIGAAVAIVAVVAGTTWWNAYQRSQAEDASRAYMEADALAAEGELAEAARRFEALAAERGGGYETVARLRAAALLAEAGERDAAVAAFDAVAGEASDPVLSDLAALRAALVLSDVASPDELAVRLTPLAEEGRPWRFTALELLAFAALRADDREAAGQHYRALAEGEGVPPLSRERARTMLRGLQLEGPVARQLPGTPTDPADAPQPDAQAEGGQ